MKSVPFYDAMSRVCLRLAQPASNSLGKIGFILLNCSSYDPFLSLIEEIVIAL